MDLSGLHPALADRSVPLTLALNQHNVLTGARGVSRVFGPQKGATPQQVEAMSAGFEHWAAVLRRDALDSARTTDFATAPGTGASGDWGPAWPPLGPACCRALRACWTPGWRESTWTGCCAGLTW